MEIEALIAMIYGISGLTILGFLIYFLIQRLNKEKSEDFEQRNN